MAEAAHQMTDFLLEYDESADAAYLQLTDAAWHHQQRPKAEAPSHFSP